MDDITAYQQICSACTVQSNKKGFFHEFYAEAKESCGLNWLNNSFNKLKSNEARILCIFNDNEICNTVLGVLENVRPVYKEKDGTISFQRRAMAEKNKLLKDFKQALMYANVAVMRAPDKGIDVDVDNGISLSLGFRTRASILIELGEGDAAISDLNLAALYGLNYKQNFEYFLQMARAYAVKGELQRAEIALNLATKISDGMNSAQINACRNELPTLKRSKTFHINPSKVPDLAIGQHISMSGASSSLKLTQTADKGRFLLTDKPLRTGDVVLCEKPIAACLLPNYFGTHCHHCFLRIILPVPCTNCAGIAFCSVQCQTEACNTYHRYECEFMDLLIGSGMSILCFIALRIFTITSNVESALNTANNLYNNLVGHQESRLADDQLQRALMSAFLLRVLQKSNYFGHRRTEGPNPTAVELKVGSALLGLLQVLQYNAHEIYETLQEPDHHFDKSRMVYVGAGLYGTGAYFNHECWPSVTRYFVGKQLVLAALRPHNVNELVAENYGPIFTKMNLKDRQRALRARYMFSCNCTVCQENWPTLKKLDKQVRLRCPTNSCQNLIHCPKDISKDVRCPSCRKNVSMKELVLKLIRVEELYREAAKAMSESNTQNAIELFKEGIDMFFDIAALPHHDTLLAQQSLIKCFADTGTTSKIMY